MATTMSIVAPQARLGGKVSIKAPSQAKAFGLGVPKNRRSAAHFKCMAYTITLKTPDGEQTVECDGKTPVPFIYSCQNTILSSKVTLIKAIYSLLR